MLSTCPSCKNQIEHEDYLFEVKCTCGTHFNPFYDANAAQAGEEPAAAAGDFKESTNAFSDIVQFGESLTPDGKPGNEMAPPVVSEFASEVGEPAGSEFPAMPGTPPPRTVPRTPPPEGSSDFSVVMTPGEVAAGHRIERYFPPISTSSVISLDSSNPLSQGYLNLSQMAESMGANAVLGMRWSLTPDGTQAIFSGFPAIIVKET